MIICEYKDGSSIRVYRTQQKRSEAMHNLAKDGYYLKPLANLSGHYSLKVIPPWTLFKTHQPFVLAGNNIVL